MNAADRTVLRALEAVTAERAEDALLSVRDLTVRFRLRGGRTVAAVSDADFDLAAGECLALVGESGCGKSVLASALLGLLPGNAETSGTALQDDTDLLAADEKTLARTVRGRRVGLVPQSPAAHLTPVRTVRSQLEETVRALTGTPAAPGGRPPRTPPNGPPSRPDTSTGTRTNSPAASPSAPPPPSPSSATPASCSPTNPPPASTATSSTAPSTSCAATSTRAAACSSSPTTSPPPHASPTASP